jgi:hypothetical protein
MKLHVVYRSTGSENSKRRPAFYDKLLALESLLRAVDVLDVPYELIFLNDGPVPAERVRRMKTAGEIIPVTCGSNRSSYRRALRLPRERGWLRHDLVWFSEDDYLYTPRALAAVVSAASQMSGADYFAVYSTLCFEQTATRQSPRVRPKDQDGNAATTSVTWSPAASTTSTFGARIGAVVDDERLLRAAPFTGGAWDHSTCLAYQGYRPFAIRELAGGDPPGAGRRSPRARARRLLLPLTRGALNVAALARSEKDRRTLIASCPDLATHLEEGELAPGHEWAEEAGRVWDWAAESGHLPASTPPLPWSRTYS